MLLERVDHFLLLLLIVAIVQVFRRVLLLHVRLRFHTLGVATSDLRLHVCQVRLVRAVEPVLQVLAHAHHACVVTSRRVDLRALSTPLKLVETTWPSFTGVLATIVYVSSLE